MSLTHMLLLQRSKKDGNLMFLNLEKMEDGTGYLTAFPKKYSQEARDFLKYFIRQIRLNSFRSIVAI